MGRGWIVGYGCVINQDLLASPFFLSLVDKPEIPKLEPFCFIWKSSVPYGVKVFAWLVFHGKINTCDMVQRRNPHSALSPSWCILCRNNGETLDHLLLHCEVASALWKILLKEAGFLWVFPAHCQSLMVEDMVGLGSNKKAKVLWRCMVLFLLWTIWMERNSRIFEDRSMELIDIFEKAKYLASLWASTEKEFKGFPFSLIILNWMDVIGRSWVDED